MDPPVLDLAGFGVAFARRVVLVAVDLRVAPRGVTSLMGPVGVGKSTLLRTLAGRNDSDPALRTWGQVTYRGAPWSPASPPTLVGQKGRTLAGTVFDCVLGALPDRSRLQRAAQRERVAALFEAWEMADLVGQLDASAIALGKGQLRCLSLVSAIAEEAPLLLVDEPTAGLGEPDRERVLRVLARFARTGAVLLVTHSRADALALPGTTALLAGGAIVENAPTSEFFRAPRSPITQGFVETGSCSVASPLSLDALVASGVVPAERLASADRPAVRQSGAWSAFTDPPLAMRWVYSSWLVGVPRPGLLGSVDRDLQALASAGVRLLVCLEETQVIAPALLAGYGIDSFALPIEDMGVPTTDDARALCAVIDDAIEQLRPVAVHCRAGLGRTGTMLCAWLIWRGLGRVKALARVRAVEPRFVQSERQHEFLAQFERHVAEHPRHGPREGSPAAGV